MSGPFDVAADFDYDEGSEEKKAMKKVTFKNGAGLEIEANVWTKINVWGDKSFAQKMDVEIDDDGCTCGIPDLRHAAWYGEATLPLWAAEEDFFVDVEAFTFYGRIRNYTDGRIEFLPRQAWATNERRGILLLDNSVRESTMVQGSCDLTAAAKSFASLAEAGNGIAK